MATKYLLLSFPLASFGLGVWQIQRRQWKLRFIEDLNRRLDADPIDLQSIKDLKELQQLEYQRVKVRGHFDFDGRQIYLKPRGLIVNDEAISRGRNAHQSSTGSNVITPYTLDNSNLRILVNRGWLPLKTKDHGESIEAIYGSKDKTIDMLGILRLSDKRYTYGMRNKETSDEWQIRDVESLAKALGTAPIFLDADQKLTPKVGPIGGQTQITVRNEHVSYIITWFGLSLCTLLFWYSRYGKRPLKSFR